jgi:prepilin-type N-terminal cleavage/methylation domain-containing protein/prepilin-type processing-associated H-X9-DG protein
MGQIVPAGGKESLETCELRIQNCDTTAIDGGLTVLDGWSFSACGCLWGALPPPHVALLNSLFATTNRHSSGGLYTYAGHIGESLACRLGVERGMRHRQFDRAFTLVELLVVIGIISLLISVLLPSLNRARQQANLLSCQSNLHTIGQFLEIYATDNSGYPPAVYDGVEYTTFADTLTLMVSKTYATVAFPGQPANADQYEPAQDSLVFRDVDLPDALWYAHACSYIANIRVFGDVNGAGSKIWDPYNNLGYGGYKQRHLATIRRASEVMMVWCGDANINGGINYGCKYNYPESLDDYQMSGGANNIPDGHGLCYPNPAQSGFNTAWYANLISLGAALTTGAAPSSQITGSVTSSYLQAANSDYTNGTTGGVGGSDVNNMRFRHLKNTTCNFLFVDGHVESRLLGSVAAKDICLNPQ